jgi:hypothetical protein
MHDLPADIAPDDNDRKTEIQRGRPAAGFVGRQLETSQHGDVRQRVSTCEIGRVVARLQRAFQNRHPIREQPALTHREFRSEMASAMIAAGAVTIAWPATARLVTVASA